MPALREVLGEIEIRRVRVRHVELDGPSPFASSLMFDFIASFMYEYDAPMAEKRAAALTLDRSLLRELLGDPQFRDLLDPEVVGSVELELQRLTDERRARTPDQLHDLLRDLGPLSLPELEGRTTGADLEEWLRALMAQRRITPVRVAGKDTYAAVEDLARLRDALGVMPPQGIAPSLLEPVADPLGDVVGRFARTRGPFSAQDAADVLGLPAAAVDEVLARLEQEGKVAAGAYRPGGAGHEWVDLEVLRRLRRRSLAVLRAEVEAVVPETLGRFVPAWQGVGQTTSRRDRIVEVLKQLQGYAIPASTLETEILPVRLSYEPAMLDDLLASGDVVWVGRGPLAASDGRMSLYFRDHAPLLFDPPVDAAPSGETHDRIRRHLDDRGASFFRDIYVAAEGGDPQAIVDAIWDLVWSGEVTNDTLAPLRAFLWGKARRNPGRRAKLSAASPPAGSGRWYRVADLMDVQPRPTTEMIGKARAEQMLERHGIVVRDGVLAEGVPGGFSGLYPVFSAMEDAGLLRRGYFVEGLGGAQFGLPGAIDRLRAVETLPITTVSAVDPANVYGAAVRWPDHETGHPARRAGAHVVLADGQLAIYVERGARSILTFGESDDDRLAQTMADLGKRHPRRMTIEKVNGEPAAKSSMAAALERAGFVVGYKGLTLRERSGRSGAKR